MSRLHKKEGIQTLDELMKQDHQSEATYRANLAPKGGSLCEKAVARIGHSYVSSVVNQRDSVFRHDPSK